MGTRKSAVLFLTLIFILAGCTRQQPVIALNDSEESVEEEPQDDESVQADAECIFVYVCGAVQNPGVYELTPGSRIYQAVERAGGFGADAAIAAVNQAQKLEDGQQVVIPTQDEAKYYEPSEGETALPGDSRININSADLTALMQLSGIGESRAQGIIKYREENGMFQTIEEIKNVTGIGEKIYEKIKENITVN